jgi:TolB-like protein/DNA-binding SARP family transcriptional activator
VLHLRLLGEIEVARDGVSMPLPPSKKTRALLAYLAATGQPHRRERLCSLLWEIPDDPRGALRWSLSRLRPIVDEPDATRIVATRDTVAFDPIDAEVDLCALRQVAREDLSTAPIAQLEALAQSFRGEFLEGIDLPDLHDFQSWCLAERENARGQQVRVLAALTERLAGKPAEALPYARQLVQADPLSEVARGRLLRLLIVLGRRGEAEQHFESAVRMFRDVGPEAEMALVRTWRQLRGETKTAPAIADAPPLAAAMPATAGATLQRQEDAPVALATDDRTGRPAVAVLPFENLSDDPENEYFSYGMTEDIIRLLARNRWLMVISRHSTAGFKGRTVDVREVGEQLGVRYVMVGSVRKNRDLVKITAELVRASDGAQLWADSYDLQLEEIFEIQEEMARQIAATIEPELSKVEQQLAARKAPENLDAWDCFQRGLWNLWAFTTPGFDTADEYFRRAIEADPKFARGHGALAYLNVQRALYDTPADRQARLETALVQARESVALDPQDCFCHCALGRALCFMRRNDEALAAIDYSIELNPSFAQAYFAQGFNLIWYGREIDAEALLDRATMLSPRDSHLWSFHHVRSLAHFSLGDYDVAAEYARRAARQPNATYRATATLAAALGQSGVKDEAQATAAELLQRKPDYRIANVPHEFFYCSDKSFIDRFSTGLRSAGVGKR